jgi:hypothetical protein
MSFDEYMKLPTTEQELMMWTEGIVVAARVDEEYKYLLVQLHSFYVEVIYPGDSEIPNGFHPFNNMDMVDPYLPEIRINFS